MKTLNNYYVTIARAGSRYDRGIIVKSCVSEMAACHVAQLCFTHPGETAHLAYQLVTN